MAAPASSSTFKLYYDIVSPYSRPLVYFARKNNLPHELVIVSLAKVEQRAPEYLNINPFGKIPAIMEQDGFVVHESSTILRYLCNTRDVADHWYPKDPRKRVQIDTFFDWFQPATKIFLAFIFHTLPMFAKKFPSFGDPLENLEATLKEMEDTFLKNRKYLTGDEISIADLQIMFFFCDLEMLEYKLDKFPKIKEWKERILATDFKEDYEEFLMSATKFLEIAKRAQAALNIKNKELVH